MTQQQHKGACTTSINSALEAITKTDSKQITISNNRFTGSYPAALAAQAAVGHSRCSLSSGQAHTFDDSIRRHPAFSCLNS